MVEKSNKRSKEATEYRKLYKTRRWQIRRETQLTRYPTCRMCADRGETAAASVADHVIEHKGDPWLFWHGQLQSLCAPCHSSTKQADEVRGYSNAVGHDGFPVDTKHPAMR